jgi:GrpB-like predicted nucleotidyltransferase (UPF0157 family)
MLISPTSPEAILTNPVIIVGYDPSWPATFQQLRAQVAARLGPLAVAIEHVGSTAVPGLAAKPIIDLDVVIADPTDLPTVIERLRPLGYHHQGDLGVPGREAFTTPVGAPPHHLYICAADTPALNRHLAFRDTLRANAELAQAYGDLKRDLAAKLGHDRAGYTEAKTRFVEDVLASASTTLPRQPIDPAAYERRAREGPCFVCQTLTGHPDYPGHFVWTDDHAVAFLASYNTLLGHTLVAPRAHREQATGDFTIEEYLTLQRLVYHVGEARRATDWSPSSGTFSSVS